MENLEQKTESGIKKVFEKTGRVLKQQGLIVAGSVVGGYGVAGLCGGVACMISPLVSGMTGTTEMAEMTIEGTLFRNIFLYGGTGFAALSFVTGECLYLYHSLMGDVDDVF